MAFYVSNKFLWNEIFSYFLQTASKNSAQLWSAINFLIFCTYTHGVLWRIDLQGKGRFGVKPPTETRNCKIAAASWWIETRSDSAFSQIYMDLFDNQLIYTCHLSVYFVSCLCFCDSLVKKGCHCSSTCRCIIAGRRATAADSATAEQVCLTSSTSPVVVGCARWKRPTALRYTGPFCSTLC